MYGYGSHLGKVTQIKLTNFHSLYTVRCHLALNDPVVLEEKMFKECG